MSLDELRKKIDELDHKLVQLLNERARVVVDIGKLKNETDKPVYAPDREKEVFERIAQANEGPLPNKCLMAIWRELMSGSFVLERPLRIGYLGPGGSFSHTAAMLKFGQSVEYEPLTDIVSIFDEVSKGHCDLGLAPVENTVGGGVIETLDALVDSNVKVCAEVLMAIHHNLLGNCPLEEVEKVYSKPEVFAQCRNWLSATFKEAKTIPVASTAKAAQLAAEEPKAAAIGSSVAAELYDLRIILEVPAIRQAARRIDDEGLAVLEDMMDTVKSMIGEHRRAEIIELDRDFHVALLKQSRNRLLCEIGENILDRVYRVQNLNVLTSDRLFTAHEHHEKICGALRKRDENEAAGLMEDHLVSAREFVLSRLKDDDDILNKLLT